MNLLIFSTGTQRQESITVPEGATWGDVKRKLEEIDFPHKDLKPAGRISGQSFNTDATIVPSNETTIFLTPNKVKSGELTLVECAAMLDTLLKADADAFIQGLPA